MESTTGGGGGERQVGGGEGVWSALHSASSAPTSGARSWALLMRSERGRSYEKCGEAGVWGRKAWLHADEHQTSSEVVIVVVTGGEQQRLECPHT